MNPERWKQIKNPLQSALELPIGDREAFLRQACSADEAMEREVRSLLDSYQEAGSFLERPAIEVQAQAIALGDYPDGHDRKPSLAGQTIFRYHIVEKAGRRRHGCGVRGHRHEA